MCIKRIEEFPLIDEKNDKVGLHLDPYRLHETVIWRFSGDKTGTTVRNAKFLNWGQEATPLKFFSHQTFIKAYQAPHVFEDLYFDDPTYSVDAVMPGSTIDDVQIEVASDSNGVFSADHQTGFLVANKFENMIPSGCTTMSFRL